MRGPEPVKITVTSVFVDDQAKALKFYTEMLGVEKRRDIPLGEAVFGIPPAHDPRALIQPPNTAYLLRGRQREAHQIKRTGRPPWVVRRPSLGVLRRHQHLSAPAAHTFE